MADSNPEHKGEGGSASGGGGDYPKSPLESWGWKQVAGAVQERCLIREVFSSVSFSQNFSDCAPLEHECSMSWAEVFHR